MNTRPIETLDGAPTLTRLEHPDSAAQTLVRAPAALDTLSDDEEATIAMHRAALGADPITGVRSKRGGAPTLASAAPTPVDVDPRPLDVADFDHRYAPGEVLGVGGMGEVRLCRDRLIGRDVALKALRAGVAESAEARERFAREARVQGQLEHPAIVPVYDLGAAPDGGVFFTMKRIRGLTLETIVDALAAGHPEVSARYSRRKLLTAFGSVCLAIDFAHRRGVLHRDLKPANVILGDFGEVYVLDWGIAKVAGGEPEADALDLTQNRLNRTMEGMLIGTPGYMPPEQARGEIERLDARSDVYSLGTILYELLALQPLHDPSSLESALLSTIRGADARPSTRVADVPPELDAICQRATALDPAQRYTSARELSDAIERFLDGDRNVQLRRDMARDHVAAARAALAQAAAGGAEAREARVTALREVGSALVLDPSNADALATMASLLTDTPTEVPREAEADLAAASASAQADASRADAHRLVVWSAFVPLALWLGVRHWPAAVAAIAAVLMSGLLSLWIVRRKKSGVGGQVALLLTTSIAIALMSALFGPFILVPGEAAINAMFFAAQADKKARRGIIVAGVLSVVAPFLLEVGGVLPPSYAFEGGLLHVLPRATELPALQTQLILLATSITMVIVPALLMGRMRDALTAAERRLFLQAWQLRQLVPSAAQQALTPCGR